MGLGDVLSNLQHVIARYCMTLFIMYLIIHLQNYGHNSFVKVLEDGRYLVHCLVMH